MCGWSDMLGSLQIYLWPEMVQLLTVSTCHLHRPSPSPTFSYLLNAGPISSAAPVRASVLTPSNRWVHYTVLQHGLAWDSYEHHCIARYC